MIRQGIAIDAAVLAPATRIDARIEADIRAFVRGDDRLAAVLEELRARQRMGRESEVTPSLSAQSPARQRNVCHWKYCSEKSFKVVSNRSPRSLPARTHS